MVIYIDKRLVKATIQPGLPVMGVPLHSSVGLDRALLLSRKESCSGSGKRHSMVQKVRRKVRDALERERHRVGVELHDNVNQLLASCKLYLEAMHLQQDDNRLMRDKALQILVKSIEDIRVISRKMVTVLPEGQSFLESIRALAATMSGSGIFQVEVKEGGHHFDRIPAGVQTALYRILQEQLTNAAKYSQASRVVIRLYREMKEVHLCVSDDGLGFDPASQEWGIGLSSIFARARKLKGVATIRSEPGQGCSLIVSIPCGV